MKILVIGSGGREHALAWKLLQSTRVQSLVMVPENAAAIVQLQKQFVGKEIQPWQDSIRGEEALKTLAQKAKDQRIDFVVVGPDNALADGAVDIFESLGIPSFGPSKEAARLESSKIFSKKIMQEAGVPTAEGHEVYSPAEAKTVLQSLDWTKKQWVIKADGLALGKGVEICETLPQALEALTRLNQYSDSFVIEERLHGKEISWLAFCDGDNCALLAPARDYKTLTEDPLSPNTGGMGAVCPVPGVDASLAEKVRTQVFEPTLREMKKRGTPYKGILYAGLMVNKDQVWVLEFNSRFGDPEAQALLPLMQDDLLNWCEASQAGKLATRPPMVPMKPLVAVYVVAAAPGYPGQPFLGKNIQGLDMWLSQHRGFFAGVKKGPDAQWLTAGGRVLGALGLGASVAEARLNAFKNLKEISFEGMQYREGVGAEWV
ncbi:phosphoribosylamine--glycine ligase [Bdellovibrio sp. HCB337]|uniref:phosphoribosylamine--glycine ligase n=1 Tax=Bdellovibrio sp. HCB337 TaxID=3394358 RepID=UPI0039A45386